MQGQKGGMVVWWDIERQYATVKMLQRGIALILDEGTGSDLDRRLPAREPEGGFRVSRRRAREYLNWLHETDKIRPAAAKG
jgi:hypothetical protein